MQKKTLIWQLENSGDENAQYQAIRQLQFYIDDAHVFEALCSMAVKTENRNIRTWLIHSLAPRIETARRRIAAMAMASESPIMRQRAAFLLRQLNFQLLQHSPDSELRNAARDLQAAAYVSHGLYGRISEGSRSHRLQDGRIPAETDTPRQKVEILGGFNPAFKEAFDDLTPRLLMRRSCG